MKKLALAGLLLLQGCATAPNTQFYSLEAKQPPRFALPSAPLQKGESLKPLIGIAQIRLWISVCTIALGNIFATAHQLIP